MKIYTVPGKNQLAATFGEHWILLDTKTGELLHSSPAQIIDKKSENDVGIRCLEVSIDLKAVVARNDKTLELWDMSSGLLLASTLSLKRINTIKFTKDGSKIILGDKTGDIYTIATAEFEKGDFRLLAGHFSLILDICFSPNQSQIISAERDEKIRVSKFPHAYCIDSFLLGHKVHVPKFAPELCISGGGDAFMILWDYVSGVEVDRFDLPEIKEEETALKDALYSAVLDIQSCSSSNVIAVVLEKRPFILLLEIEDNKLCLKQRVEVQRDVLSIRFDENDDLWMSHGSTQVGNFDKEMVKERVSVSRFSAGSYSAVSSDDEITKKINILELRAVEIEVDHYDMSKLGKKEIKRKDELETLRKKELTAQQLAKQKEKQFAREEETKRMKLEKDEQETASKKQKVEL